MTADVAVVGGGIVGTATAAFLAEAGLRVTLVEATQIAAGASGRNSGVIQQPFDPALVGLYRRSLELYRELAIAAPDRFRIDPEPSGLLLVGPEAATDEARRLVADWTAAYPETGPELVTGGALTALEPGLAGDLAACRLGIGYLVGPASATGAYAAVAERLGVRILTGAGASLAIEGDRVVGVAVDGTTEQVGVVVVAAGPWTPSVFGRAGAWPPIGASWGVVAGLALDRPPHHALEEIDIDIEPVASAETEEDATDRPRSRCGDGPAPEAGFGFSLVTADGSSALGSTFLPEPPAAEAETLRRLRTRGARYVPAVDAAPLIAVRTCARPVTPDGRPLLGAVPGLRGAYVGAGHGPWGISTGPGSARLLADLVLGRDRERVPSTLDVRRYGGWPPSERPATAQRIPVPGYRVSSTS